MKIWYYNTHANLILCDTCKFYIVMHMLISYYNAYFKPFVRAHLLQLHVMLELIYHNYMIQVFLSNTNNLFNMNHLFAHG